MEEGVVISKEEYEKMVTLVSEALLMLKAVHVFMEKLDEENSDSTGRSGSSGDPTLASSATD